MLLGSLLMEKKTTLVKVSIQSRLHNLDMDMGKGGKLRKNQKLTKEVKIAKL